MNMGREQRVIPRVQVTVTVRYFTSDGKQFDGLTDDIGGGGLFIRTHQPLPVGTPLIIKIPLPFDTEKQILVKAKVVSVHVESDRNHGSAGMGLQFTDLSPQARAQVLEFIVFMNKERPLQSGLRIGRAAGPRSSPAAAA